jgi:PhnB protein
MPGIQLQPYLLFHGQCREAFEFYSGVLHGEIETMMTHRESPAAGQVPADWQDTIIHATLRVGDAVLMASDAPPQYQEKMGGFSVSLQVPELEEGRRIFGALSEGGRVTMSFDRTFWSGGFGMCIDRFGVPWMVNYVPVGQPAT